MKTTLRTHTNGELTGKDVDKEVALAGWVHTRRDHGGVIFIDLRDRKGLTQIVFNPEFNNESITDYRDIRYPGNGLAEGTTGYVAPREKLTVNVFYVALTWNMFRKPYYYYDYNRTEKADQMY